MGSQIGCEFVVAGHRVTWISRSRARAERNVETALETAHRYRLDRGKSIEELRAATTVAADVDAVDVDVDVDLVLESVPERLELKVELLGVAAARWPRAILATNTSSLSISAIGAGIGEPERVIGMHFWNPPLLMPLVEVVVGADTAPETLERAVGWVRELGKEPVVVAREVPGFVWNRLQLALLREALWLVQEGVADPATVDQVVRDGLARRWRLTGPFETAELGGLETFAIASENVFPELSVATAAPALRNWRPRPDSELAELLERRDRALARELHTASSDPVTDAQAGGGEDPGAAS